MVHHEKQAAQPKVSFDEVPGWQYNDESHKKSVGLLGKDSFSFIAKDKTSPIEKIEFIHGPIYLNYAHIYLIFKDGTSNRALRKILPYAYSFLEVADRAFDVSKDAFIFDVADMRMGIVEDFFNFLANRAKLLTPQAAQALAKIFYLGISQHSTLGDSKHEIDAWLKQRLPDKAIAHARKAHEKSRQASLARELKKQHKGNLKFLFDGEDCAKCLGEQFDKEGDVVRAIEAYSLIESTSPLYLEVGLRIDVLAKKLPFQTEQERFEIERQYLLRLMEVLIFSHNQVPLDQIQNFLGRIANYCRLEGEPRELFPTLFNDNAGQLKYWELSSALAKHFCYLQNQQEGQNGRLRQVYVQIDRLFQGADYERLGTDKKSIETFLQALRAACGLDKKQSLFSGVFLGPGPMCLEFMDKIRELSPVPEVKEAEEAEVLAAQDEAQLAGRGLKGVPSRDSLPPIVQGSRGNGSSLLVPAYRQALAASAVSSVPPGPQGVAAASSVQQEPATPRSPGAVDGEPYHPTVSSVGSPGADSPRSPGGDLTRESVHSLPDVNGPGVVVHEDSHRGSDPRASSSTKKKA